MVYSKRIKYTDEMMSYIWDRYQAGDARRKIIPTQWSLEVCWKYRRLPGKCR